jgi:serine/threonine protein kinase
LGAARRRDIERHAFLGSAARQLLPPARADIEIAVSTGRIVGSKYCLLYELGRGGMGSVWAAEHLALRSQVAVKLIEPALAARAEIVQRFEREARAAASLRGPNVVQIFDFGVDDGSPYLVMELLEGESLGERLARRPRLPPEHIAAVMEQIGRAMTRAHSAGFMHRDLKPDNVFLVEDSDGFIVKVLDFGIAKSIVPPPEESGTHLTDTGAFIGTPHYMSPEQAEGRADASSDLWSMAVIAFECVTGRLPFAGDSLPALLRSICYDPIVPPSAVASVPPGFDAWFLGAVTRDPTLRPRTAKELVDGLLPLLQLPRVDWDHSGRGKVAEAEADSGRAPTLQLRAFPSEPLERRLDSRVPSSIPAGINRRRDLEHAALIYNASRRGALLATRHACQPGQPLVLTLQVAGGFDGQVISGRVVRVTPRAAGSLWKFDVGVHFEAPLSDGLLLELRQRAQRSGV